MRVLVVDDDEEIRVSLRRALALDGHDATLEADAEGALERLRGGERFDVVVLDRGLPGIDGVEACRRIRAAELDVAVLMVTALGAVRDRVDGLDAGADDYVVKPFDIDEFLARVRAVARRRPERSSPGAAAGSGAARVVRVGDLSVDESSWTARRGERALELTRTEFRLLLTLAERAGSVIGRAELMQSVWDYDFGTSSSNLDVYVSYLRRKLEADGEPRLLHTVRGVGYVLRADA
ncbi:MAG: two component transcriptional regulator, winged helix family [Thermoleophilia bacterium]|nr:two component transcriptional regulator, winged helix family [Thermoleophilia bacterium]